MDVVVVVVVVVPVLFVLKLLEDSVLSLRLLGFLDGIDSSSLSFLFLSLVLMGYRFLEEDDCEGVVDDDAFGVLGDVSLDVTVEDMEMVEGGFDLDLDFDTNFDLEEEDTDGEVSA